VFGKVEREDAHPDFGLMLEFNVYLNQIITAKNDWYRGHTKFD
jgi:hypothetical protein